MLTQPRAEVVLKISGHVGEASLQENVYGALLDQLADHQPKTLGQLAQSLPQLSTRQLLEAAMVLTGTGALHAAQPQAAVTQTQKRCTALNRHLLDKARSDGQLRFLASPVIGGGVAVGRFEQLFLLAKSQGKKAPADWAQFVWQVLAAQNQRIIKDGQTLATPEENLAELTEQAQEFAAKRLPLLSALGVG